MIEIYFDGAVQPTNPGGHGGYGLAVIEDGRLIFSEAIYIGRWPELSNNCAEYCGAIAALRYLLRENVNTATVYGDASLVISQLNGEWRCNGGAYIPYFREAYTLRLRVPDVAFKWVPREQNSRADTLSKEAVVSQPRIIGFALDAALELAELPVISRRRHGKPRERRTERQESDTEVWEDFNRRYGGS